MFNKKETKSLCVTKPTIILSIVNPSTLVNNQYNELQALSEAKKDKD